MVMNMKRKYYYWNTFVYNNIQEKKKNRKTGRCQNKNNYRTTIFKRGQTKRILH